MQASSGTATKCEQADRPLPMRKRHSRKPARGQPMLPTHEAAAPEEPKQDPALPSKQKRSRQPKKQWQVSSF